MCLGHRAGCFIWGPRALIHFVDVCIVLACFRAESIFYEGFLCFYVSSCFTVKGHLDYLGPMCCGLLIID